ncbi:MAG TPA: sulfatase-like hydrolase/transferase, partial [Anaerolineae bacterium]
MMTHFTSHKRPNLVLVLCDSMRAGNVSAHGYHQRTTPNLDRLASKGMRFQNAFVQAPFTIASTASILTGVYPSVHRLESYGQRLDGRLDTLPELLRAAGYYTAGFVANPHVNPDSGLTRGFTCFTDGRPWYKQLPGVKRLSAWAESGKALNRRVQEVLPKIHDQPFFFFVFYNDSHVPFSDLPRILLPLAGRKFHSPDFESVSYTDEELARVVALYNRALQRADRRLGELYRLIQRSPHAADTIFLISADHGEGLDRRFERAGHGRLYENGIHVPLVIRAPKMAYAGKVVAELATSLDLSPTICELAGVKVPAQFQGNSLTPYLRNEASKQPRSHIISEYHDSRCVRTKEWKLIQRGAGI